MKTNITVPLSADPLTGTPRLGQLEYFQILPDLNMVNVLRVRYLTPAGTPKLEAIAADDSLSDYQKQVAAQQFADRVVPRQTTGSFVDPMTGSLVGGDTPGAMPQRDYFQAITLADLRAQGIPVNDQTTLAELIYAMLAGEIRKSDARKEI